MNHQKIENIEANLHIVLGRLNAVHAGLLVVAKHIPADKLAAAANEIRTSAEAIHADALATPIPESTLNEMQRVLHELAQVLLATHDRIQPDPQSRS
jgi:hypothetical protein